MKLIRSIFIVSVLFVGAAQIVPAQAETGLVETATGIATMFARDPLSRSLCFKDGDPGHVFQNGQVRNRCSDVTFDSYDANQFSVGVEGGRLGVILDLGTAQELKGKYGYQETVGNGQGFASIDVRNGRALILKDYKTGELQEINESAQLFKIPGNSYTSIPVKVGHIYLMRVIDRNDRAFEMFAKLLVLAYVPGESVTVRWQLISNSETAKR